MVVTNPRDTKSQSNDEPPVLKVDMPESNGHQKTKKTKEASNKRQTGAKESEKSCLLAHVENNKKHKRVKQSGHSERIQSLEADENKHRVIHERRDKKSSPQPFEEVSECKKRTKKATTKKEHHSSRSHHGSTSVCSELTNHDLTFDDDPNLDEDHSKANNTINFDVESQMNDTRSSVATSHDEKRQRQPESTNLVTTNQEDEILNPPTEYDDNSKSISKTKQPQDNARTRVRCQQQNEKTRRNMSNDHDKATISKSLMDTQQLQSSPQVDTTMCDNIMVPKSTVLLESNYKASLMYPAMLHGNDPTIVVQETNSNNNSVHNCSAIDCKDQNGNNGLPSRTTTTTTTMTLRRHGSGGMNFTQPPLHLAVNGRQIAKKEKVDWTTLKSPPEPQRTRITSLPLVLPHAYDDEAVREIDVYLRNRHGNNSKNYDDDDNDNDDDEEIVLPPHVQHVALPSVPSNPMSSHHHHHPTSLVEESTIMWGTPILVVGEPMTSTNCSSSCSQRSDHRYDNHSEVAAGGGVAAAAAATAVVGMPPPKNHPPIVDHVRCKWTAIAITITVVCIAIIVGTVIVVLSWTRHRIQTNV